MVFLDSVVIGLVLGILLGGTPAALGELTVRRLWLAYMAIALQVLAFPSNVLPWTTPDLVARSLWLISYALLIAMILDNRHLRGIGLIAAGLVCNLVAIVVNGGLMPVTEDALRGAGLSYDVRNNSVALGDPHLVALVDRFAAPAWLPLGNVFSVGDVFIGVGTVIAIVVAMKPRLFRALPRRGPLRAAVDAGMPIELGYCFGGAPMTLDDGVDSTAGKAAKLSSSGLARDLGWLERAVELAAANAAAGGRPFGAVVVLDGRIVGEGVNGYVAVNDPTAHAEVAAIRAATRSLGTARLDGAVLAASTEPCPMCQAAALLAGVGRVVFATTEAQAAERGYDARELLADLDRPFAERRAMAVEHVMVADEAMPYAWADAVARDARRELA